MRLFHTQVQKDNTTLTIIDERVLKHASVLRLQVLDSILIQEQSDSSTTRWEAEIAQLSKNRMTLKIKDEETIVH